MPVLCHCVTKVMSWHLLVAPTPLCCFAGVHQWPGAGVCCTHRQILRLPEGWPIHLHCLLLCPGVPWLASFPRWSMLQPMSSCCVPLPCMVPACRRLQLLVCLLRLARSIRLCWPALPSLTLGHQAALLLQHSCPVSGRSTFASHLPSMQLAAAHQPSSPACRSWLPSLLASALAGTTTLWMASATANSAACHTGGDAGSLSQAALCALALHEDLRNCAGNTAVYCVTSGALSPVAWHRQHPSKPVLQTAVLALLQAWNWRLAVCHDQVPQCPSCLH